MIYLTGVHSAAIAAAARTMPLGVILTPNVAYRPETASLYRWWAADNGCFTQGASFRLDRFLAWLDRHDRRDCLFVVAPDVPFNAKATLETFFNTSGAVRGKHFPVALAAQNGLGNLEIPWADLDAIFIGGDTEWKLSHEAGRIAYEARQRGKWVHMGRANSRRRLARALAMGCDSADGTFLRWPTTNLPRLRRWFVDLSGQAHLLDRAVGGTVPGPASGERARGVNSPKHGRVAAVPSGTYYASASLNAEPTNSATWPDSPPFPGSWLSFARFETGPLPLTP